MTDPGHYGVIWAAEEGDDPYAETTWRKANPGLGASPSLAYMRREANKARSTPSYFPTFCRLSLNRRMRSSSRWLPLPLWDENAGAVDEKQFRYRRAWGGVDPFRGVRPFRVDPRCGVSQTWGRAGIDLPLLAARRTHRRAGATTTGPVASVGPTTVC
ncbi:terminase TerL endonuclease subunit [Streptomyces buecherae]|uniref:terminase TerL endonuclease subunit n=1 Tax=Streptomyces buecherae TaxID=2763006 RepID=UPI0027E252A4|nr:terminase TerL endonuclease subunit [Streptomyces buecherae]